MADINDLLIRIDGTTEQLRRELKRAESSVDTTGRKVDATAKRIDQGFAGMGSAAKKLAGAFAVTFGARAMGQYVMNQIGLADQTAKLAQRLGTTTEFISEMQHVAKLAGVEFDGLTKGMQRLTTAIGEAAQGTGLGKRALDALKLSAKDLQHLSLEQQFERVTDALAGVENETQRVTFASQLFGQRGVELLQIMNDGTAAMREGREEARRLGLSLSTEAAKKAEEASDAMDRLKGAVGALGRDMALVVAGPLANFADGLRNLMFGGMSDSDLLSEEIRQQEAALNSLYQRLADARTREQRLSGRNRANSGIGSEIAGLERDLRGVLSSLDFLRDRASAVAREVETAAGASITSTADRLETIGLPGSTTSRRRRIAPTLEDPTDTSDDFRRLQMALRTQEEAIQESYGRRLEIIKSNTEAGTAAQIDMIQRLDAKTKDQLDALIDDVDDKMHGFGSMLGTSVHSLLSDIFQGTETDFSSMLKRMAADLAASQLLQFLGSLAAGGTGRFSSFAAGMFGMPTRHTGGDVRARRPYLVKPNEEMFVPSVAGRVSASGGAGNWQPKIIVQNYGAAQGVTVKARSSGPGIAEIVVGMVTSAISQGKFDTPMGSRYGQRPVTGTR